MDLFFVLDHASNEALWRQIYAQWRSGILAGRFTAGERVPSTRAFAEACNVARITATAAYDQLLAEGYFETRRGSGTFISAELPDDALRPLRTSQFPKRSLPRTPTLSRFGKNLGTPHTIPTPTRPLNLSNVNPDLVHFPFALWRRLLARHLRSASALYSGRAGAAGHEPLRAAIAAHISRTRAVRCTPDQVIVVGGSQQALDLCARLFLDPGDHVAVENPGYTSARQLFRAHGASLVALPVTDCGASITRLRAKPRIVHVTPSHQMPTGVSMSLSRRLELLEWARKNGIVVIEDDYDSDFRYTGPPLPAMQSLSDGGSVIYLGTFSNVMFRGLRIGYLVVPKDLIDPFTAAKWIADRHTPLLEQAALADFLAEGHLDRHIRRMRTLYKKRRDALIEALNSQFGDRVTIRGDAAGLHFTARFRKTPDVSRVHLLSTAAYYHSNPAPNEFILGFASLPERMLRDAVKHLRDSRLCPANF